MRAFLASAGFIARRMRANWRLLSVVAVGVLVASVLMAITSIYTRALADLGLDFALSQRVGERGPVFTEVPNLQRGGERSAEVRAFVEESIDERFGDFSVERLRIGLSPLAFKLTLPQFANASNPPGGRLVSLSDWETRVDVVEGRLPEPLAIVVDVASGLPQRINELEVALPARHAARVGLAVGDTIPFVDQFDECDREPPGPPGSPPPPPRPPCSPTLNISIALSATVVGLIEQRDPGALFWTATRVNFEFTTSEGGVGPVVALFVDDRTMFEGLAAILPGYLMVTSFVDSLEIDLFNTARLDELQAAFDTLRTDMGTVGGLIRGPIESTLDTFERDLNFTEVPILLLLVQIVAIVLFYVVIVTTMLVEREEEEIALLRSRGASLRQMLSVYATEGLVIALIAAAAAPFIAGGVVNLLGYTSTFEPVTGGRPIATTLTSLAWGLAAGGAIFSIVAILVPVALVARGATAAVRRRAARPSGPNIFQRHFLDLAFVVIAVGLIFEADLRGSAFERNSVGGLSSDPLVLVTPALFALTFAVALLRLLPYVFRLLTWLVRDRVSVWMLGALRQTVRNPGPATRLTLLLMLGAALATFAASYGGTVDRSFEERTRYTAGVDLRASLETFGPRPPDDVVAILSEAPGIQSASPVFRGVASSARTAAGAFRFELLALRPDEAGDLLWFRDDLAPSSLRDLMRRIGAPDVGRGLILPNDAEQLRIWAMPTLPRDDMTVWLRLSDGRGRFFVVRMGSLDRAGEWRQLIGNVGSAIRGMRGVPPFAVHSVFMTEIFGGTFGDAGFILYDDLSVVDAGGEERLLEDFEGARLGWEVIGIRTDRVDTVGRLESDDAISGRGTLQFTWSLGSSTGLRGFVFRDSVLCPGGSECRLPLIGSTTFLDERGLRVGSKTDIRIGDLVVAAFIVDEADFFPTLDPAGGGFAIANLDHLYYLASIADFDSAVFPNESWMVGPDDPEFRASTIETLLRRPYQLAGFVDMQRLVAEEGSDPLTAAGGSGILLVAFVAVGSLVALAFLVTVYITAQRRMVEMAVLRTLGVSGRQMYLQLALEYALIVAIGLAVGTVLGTLVTGLMLSFLEVTELGQPVLPPFVIETDWVLVAVSYAVLVGVFTLGVTGAWRFFVRLPLNRVLRLSE